MDDPTKDAVEPPGRAKQAGRRGAGAAKGAATGAAKGSAKQGTKEAGKQAGRDGAKGAAKGAQKGGTKGAQVGAKIGSVLPGAGTAVGGVVGGAVGAGAGGAAGGVAGSAKGAAKGGAKGAAKGGVQGAKSGAKDGAAGAGEAPPVDGIEERGKAAVKGAAKGALKGAATGGASGALSGALRGGAKGAKDGGTKKRGKGKLVAAALPVVAVGVAMAMFVMTVSSMIGASNGEQARAAGASTRAGVPPAVLGIYREAAADSAIPWEILASLGHETTANGTNAPDGVSRELPVSPEDQEFIEAAEAAPAERDGADSASSSSTTATTASTTSAPTTTAAGSTATTTTAANTTTTTPADAGKVIPVADPPIVDDSDGGPWLGVFLVDEDAWALIGPGLDAQRLEDQAKAVAETLASEVSDADGFEPGGDIDANKAPWIATVAGLPIKGLNGGGGAETTATKIIGRAIAWSNGEDWCAGTASAGGGAVGLPTAGPIKIGDPLQFSLQGPLVFTETAWKYAVPIVQEARRRGLSDRAAVIALGTSIVETGGIKMYANSTVPESLTFPHDAVGSDHDSVGLFQQRQSWGPTADLMDPTKSAGLFYDALVKVPDWETIDLGVAAQKVQISAEPQRYLPAMTDGVAILATVDASGLGGKSGSTTSTGTTTAAGATPTTTAASGGATTTVPPPTTGTTTPSKVLVVGDSLTVGAKDSGQLPSTWTVDAEVGRTTAQGVTVLEGKTITDFDAVVIALGANDYSATEEAFKDQIASVMTLVGSSKPVWWVNVDTGSTHLAAAADGPNKALADVAGTTYPNLRVGDWNAAAASGITADMRASDNTHYNAAGYVVYGKFIAGLPAGTVPAAPAENCAGTQAPGAIDIDTGAPVALCPILSAQTNCQIVAELNAMIAAAAIDGTTLTIGNSYRNPQQQIDLRRQHCGPTHYDIYERPSGECHPPTARPGSSQHEKGLAIDFASCSTHSSACYVWLAANADRFGFYNLPSEAWHWSTTGS